MIFNNDRYLKNIINSGVGDAGGIGGSGIGEGTGPGGPGGSGGPGNAAAGNAAAAAGIGKAGVIGGGGFSSGVASNDSAGVAGGVKGADPTASGDPTSQGFGGTVAGGSVGKQGQSLSESRDLARQAAVAEVNGTMTSEEAVAAVNAIGDQTGWGFVGRAAAHQAFNDQQIDGVAGMGLAGVGLATGLPARGIVTGVAGILGAAGATAGPGTTSDAPSGGGTEGKDPLFQSISDSFYAIVDSGTQEQPGVLASVDVPSVPEPGSRVKVPQVNVDWRNRYVG